MFKWLVPALQANDALRFGKEVGKSSIPRRISTSDVVSNIEISIDVWKISLSTSMYTAFVIVEFVNKLFNFLTVALLLEKIWLNADCGLIFGCKAAAPPSGVILA